jgi:uncharacterized protein (TIGR02118 family)
MTTAKIKVSVMYPNGEGKHFDLDYYLHTHMALVKRLMGDLLKGSSVEKGIAGGQPGAPATYAAIGHMYFDSVQDFGKAIGPNAKEILGDIPNFTNIEPITQISEMVM